MANKLFNRAKMGVSGTPGTGAATLGSAATGYQAFSSSGVANGDIVSYLIEDGINVEVGIGTYSSTGPTLTRTTVIFSTNSNAAISATSAAMITLTVLSSDLDVNHQQFDASGTWTKPPKGIIAYVRVWGPGGSGGRGSWPGGGGGGGYNEGWFLLSDLGATETVTIGSGGAGRTTNNLGNAGGNSSFGSKLVAYGGGGGDLTCGGGGGGLLSAAGLSGVPGKPYIVCSPDGDGTNTVLALAQYAQGGGGGGTAGGVIDLTAYKHGGGGGLSTSTTPGPGWSSVYGGGGGGGLNAAGTIAYAGGASTFGGAGGAAGTTASGVAGTQPGGGGGATKTGTTSGAGGAGRVIVEVF